MWHADSFLFQCPLSFKRFLFKKRIHVISTSDEKEVCDGLLSHTLYILMTRFPFQSFSSLVVGKILKRMNMAQKIFHINVFFQQVMIILAAETVDITAAADAPR